MGAATSEHFTGVCKAGGGGAFPAQHACNFCDTGLILEWCHFAAGAGACLLFGNHQVVVGTGCDLGQVGNGQHLPVARQLLHQLAHGFGHCPAHAGVHLWAVPNWLVVTAMASAMRESSPPDATLPTGRGVLPACPATKKPTSSSPEAIGCSDF